MNFTTDPFLEAQKEQTKFRLCVTGPSGSGKTRTALEIASRIAIAEKGKLALLDSEGKSSLLNRNRFEFRIMPLRDKYDPAQYVAAIEAAGQFGYAALVMDSLSAAWNAKGGTLEIVDAAAKKMGNNKWAGWAEGRPRQNALANAVVNTPVHLVATMRSRTTWDQVLNKNNKLEPVKVGVEPVQSDEMEYEFTIGAHLDMEHRLTITKSRFDEYPFGTIVEDYDKFVTDVLQWVNDGIAPLVDLRELDKARAFFAYWRGESLTDADILKALQVGKISEWTKGRSAADKQIADYIESQLPPADGGDETAVASL